MKSRRAGAEHFNTASPDDNTRPRRRIAPVSPPYVLFLAGRFLGTLANGSQAVVLGWEVYEIARRTMSVAEAAFAVGTIGLPDHLIGRPHQFADEPGVGVVPPARPFLPFACNLSDPPGVSP